MGFEALPVVRQLSRKPDLPVKLTRARIGALSTCRIELASPRGIDLTREGFAQVAKQILGERRELVAIRAAVRLRRGTTDALAEPARIVLPVAQPCRAEGIVRHRGGNIRRSPAARGSGFTLKSA